MVGYNPALANLITKGPTPIPFFKDKHPVTVLRAGASQPVTTASTSDTRPQQDSSMISKTPITSVTPTISNTTSGSGSSGEMRPPSSILPMPRSLKSKVSPGVVTGIVMEVFTLFLSVGLAWYFARKKKRSATRTEPSGKLHPSPFPLPDPLNVGEAPPHSRTKNNPVAQAIGSNDTREPEQRKGPIDTEEEGIIPVPSAAADEHPTVEERPSLEVRKVGIFHHTDSGWRLAFERRSQPSESGTGSLLEMPPSYSEAG
ncbi:hypothetical protein PQX77_014601 [Marasmius sp. AFHP31]|nr:hypothetical protein PQX77_014601 [Marasmius sp. AFHP31]